MMHLKNLTKIYQKPGQAPIRALDGIDLCIGREEFVAILGPSGSGKSTLMNVMGLLDKPDGGSYEFNGKDVYALTNKELAAFRNRTIGFVFQSFHLLARTTAIENVQLPLLYSNSGDFAGKSRRALEAVGLWDRARHYTHELSGGQQQRVAIARAIVNDPDVILADEPTGNLDAEAEAGIIALFGDLNRSGRTVVFITHSAQVAAQAKRVIRIDNGGVISDTKHV